LDTKRALRFRKILTELSRSLDQPVPPASLARITREGAASSERDARATARVRSARVALVDRRAALTEPALDSFRCTLARGACM